MSSTAPVFGGLDDTPTFIEGGTAAVMDDDVTISDTELDALGNYNGATLTLVRNGGANAQDEFAATGGALTQGTSLMVGAVAIGTVTQNIGGTLVLTFNANATGALVNEAMRQITYSNTATTRRRVQL